MKQTQDTKICQKPWERRWCVFCNNCFNFEPLDTLTNWLFDKLRLDLESDVQARLIIEHLQIIVLHFWENH